MEDEASKRPYASPGNIRDVLRRYRAVNLPQVISPTDLSVAGVPENVYHRVTFALKFLGMVTDKGQPTQEWKTLCAATDEDYVTQLAAMVRHAYAEVFQRVNPATDPQEIVRQAFQPYTPKSQIDRMVTFFLTMCAEAGIATVDAPKNRPTRRQSQSTKAAPTNGRQTPKPAVSTTTALAPTPPPAVTPPALSLQPDYGVIAAIMGRLPSNHRWTEAQRKRWVAAVEAAVDLVVDVVEGPA